MDGAAATATTAAAPREPRLPRLARHEFRAEIDIFPIRVAEGSLRHAVVGGVVPGFGVHGAVEGLTRALRGHVEEEAARDESS